MSLEARFNRCGPMCAVRKAVLVLALCVAGVPGGAAGQSLATYQARLAFRPPPQPAELVVVRYDTSHPVCAGFKSFRVEDGAGVVAPSRLVWRSAEAAHLLVYTGSPAIRGSELYVFGFDQPEAKEVTTPWSNDLMRVGVTVKQRGSPTLPSTWERFLYFWEKSSTLLAAGVEQDMDMDDFSAMMVRLAEQHPSAALSVTNTTRSRRNRREIEAGKKAAWREQHGRPAVLVRMDSLVVFPSDGDYRMALACQDSGYVLVDGELVLSVESGAVPSGWQIGEARRYRAGLHTVEVMTASTEPVIRVGWAPPGEEAIVELGGESLLAPSPVLDGRFEVRGRFVHADFSHTLLDAYKFRDMPGVFTPVRFTDASRNPGGASVTRRWLIGGSVYDSAAPTHTFSEPGQYPVRLDLADSLGATGSCERVVDVRVMVAQEYAVDFDLGGLPSACFDGDPVSPFLVGSGKGPAGVGFGVEWSFLGGGTNEISGGATNVALAGQAVKVDLGKHDVHGLSSLTWRVRVANREIKAGRVTFARAPFTVWPESVVADRLCDRTGGQTVLVTSIERSDDSYDQQQRVPSAGPVILLDDTLVPYADPGGERDAYAAMLPRFLNGGREVRFASIAPPEESGGSLKSLAKFVSLPKAAGDDADRTVVLSTGIHDMLLGGDDGSFERGLAALVDKLLADNAAVVLVTPPPYTGMETRLRRWAVAVRRVADARCLPVADLYTAFMGMRGEGGPYFELDGLGLTARGHRLAAERIARTLRSGMVAE
jgi:lysophospholipase L1-like esterase